MRKTENHRGYLWPTSDTEARKVIFDTVTDMEPALELTGERALAFQAGGNCGVWANWLADRFEHVVTCEPVPLLFECLSHNVKRKGNVSAYKCGLAHAAQPANVQLDPRNMGAGYLEFGDGSGAIQLRTVDSLLKQCSDAHTRRLGFLCLDIEGMELLALQGAYERILSDQPIIQIEDKGLSRKYGIEKGEAERWLADQFGYVVHSRPHRDVILKPGD